MKPKKLVADAILDCSRRGGVVLDVFAGSGTTLVAGGDDRPARLRREIDPNLRRRHSAPDDRGDGSCPMLDGVGRSMRWQPSARRMTPRFGHERGPPGRGRARCVDPLRLHDQPRISLDRPGLRSDGRQYAEGNTTEDGDYRVGKNRPPEHSRFKVGDGRRRGRRPKGQRNFDKDWEDELGRTVQLTRDGRQLRVSAHRAQVMTALSLAAKGRERSQELVFRKASELADPRSRCSRRATMR